MENRSAAGAAWIDESLVHLVHRVAQCATDLYLTSAKNVEVTARQVTVLSAVAQDDGLSQMDLVARTGIDRSTIADVVRRLKRKGLLDRRRTKQDARAYAVRLTEDGRRVLKVVEPLARKVDATILATLSVKDREHLIRMLQTMVRALQPAT